MPLDLQSRDAFFARCRSPKRKAPMPQRNPGFFINRSKPNRELPIAVITAPQEPFVSFASFAVNHLVNADTAAMHTARRITPSLFLEKLNSSEFVRTNQRHVCNDFGFGEAMLFVHASNFILNAKTCQVIFRPMISATNGAVSMLADRPASQPPAIR
jgi:hypothetical protein